MKQLTTILLTVTILAQSLVQVSVVVYYHLNKAYITQQLCENKSNPNMHCNGHCYLSKQLKKAEENERKSVQFIKEKQEVIANHARTLPEVYYPSLSLVEFPVSSSHLYFSDSEQSLLKPPAA